MEYTLIKSWRKTLSITVKHSEIIVRAPYLTSRSTLERFLFKNQAWIDKKLATQRDTQPLSMHQIQDLKNKAKTYIPKRVDEIARKFWKTYNRIKITSASTRWGSCTSKKNLNFSYRLMACPKHVIDYVIIHELAHLKEMNHSYKFWKHVSEMKPDYKNDELWLKANWASIW